MRKTVVLVILDGWGIGRKDATNPIYTAKPVNIEYLKRNYLAGSLQASGIAVGLPWGEEGNSEVGHLTIGAGKIIYQHYPRISLAIKNGDFFKNPVLKAAFDHSIENNSAVNLAGLLTQGNVHASFDHLEALIEYAVKSGVKKLNLHVFTDGKDSPPASAIELVNKLERFMSSLSIGKIGSVSGRYYALDRDEHYDRTQKCREAIIGAGPKAPDAKTHIENNYLKQLKDEHIEPVVISEDNCLKANDSLIFFDFREDSIRQIAESFIVKPYDKFAAAEIPNLFVATFTSYSPKFSVPVAFPQEEVTNPLGRALSDAGKVQIRIAETEKYAHATYFFNGLNRDLYKNEYRIMIPSKNVARYDEYPEMMAKEIASRAVQAVNERGSDFILVNFANADIVAHTGNFDATAKAVTAVDWELRRILDACLANDAVLVITADHGNAEQLINPLTGAPETSHDPNPVPVYVVGKDFVSIKDDAMVEKSENESSGILSDVAPTILEIMGIPKPPEMTGESLLQTLY